MADHLATYTFVVARSRDGAIGRGNALPWKLPSDLRSFKTLTMGKPIVMGRRTFKSIGRPLPGRPNIVISREGGTDQPGLYFVKSKDEAMRLAQSKARDLRAKEIMIVGGAEIFNLFGREVTKVHLTEVDTAIPEGDAHYLRDFNNADWVPTYNHRVIAEAGDEYNYIVTTYERRRAQISRQASAGREFAHV